MSDKTFSFRFDIDTPACLKVGVPNLMRLAERLDVQFTFFLSMGRSISRRGTLTRMLSKVPPPSAPSAEALSARTKLGNFGYLKLAAFNPCIGRNNIDLVRELDRAQELGLHGGRNHDTWHHGAASWSLNMLKDELDWALKPLNEYDIKPKGFSCPGWTEAPGLVDALTSRGFSYRADRHGLNERGAKREGKTFVDLATNILAEPGGVAYLEHQRALHRTDAEVAQDFKRHLGRVGEYAVVYDHPYFAGISALAQVELCVKIARDEGYTVMPLGRLADNLREHSA